MRKPGRSRNFVDNSAQDWFISGIAIFRRDANLLIPIIILHRVRRIIGNCMVFDRKAPGFSVLGLPEREESIQFGGKIILMREHGIDALDLPRGRFIAGRPTPDNNHVRSARYPGMIGEERQGMTGLQRRRPRLRLIGTSARRGRQHRKTRGPSNGLAALAGRLHGNATTIDDSQLGLIERRGFDKPPRPQQGRNLFALVLIHLATERLNGKASHFDVGRELSDGQRVHNRWLPRRNNFVVHSAACR